MRDSSFITGYLVTVAITYLAGCAFLRESSQAGESKIFVPPTRLPGTFAECLEQGGEHRGGMCVTSFSRARAGALYDECERQGFPVVVFEGALGEGGYISSGDESCVVRIFENGEYCKSNGCD